jgi:Ca2+-binding RTX toxin-like protein
MVYFQRVGVVSDGPATHVAGIGALALTGTGTAARLVSASGQHGGLIVRDAGSLALTEQAAFGRLSGTASLPQLSVVTLAGREALVLHGQGAGASLWWNDVTAAGGRLLDVPATLAFGGQTVLGLDTLALPGGGDALYTTSLQSNAITQWLRGADGVLTRAQTIAVPSDNGTAPTAPALASGAEITAPVTFSTAAGNWLLAAETRGNSLALWRLDAAGRATLAERLTAAEGLAIASPTRIETLSADGRNFVLVGSAGSGSVTVLELTAAGRLVIRDQVNDTLATRLDGLSVLEAVTVGGRSYVVAGGTDDGLTLMALMPGGRLIHLATIADTAGTTLANPAALALHVSGRLIEVHVAGAGESGHSRLRIDTAVFGDILKAGTAGGRLDGTARDDILVDGAGKDQLTGGAGADIFVMLPDGAVDRIMDFTPGQDRIDLSAWGRIHDLSALTFIRIGGGIEIRHGDERLQVFRAGGNTLDQAEFTAADLLGLDHVAAIRATAWQPPPPPPTPPTPVTPTPVTPTPVTPTPVTPTPVTPTPPVGPVWPVLTHPAGPGRSIAGTTGNNTLAGTTGDDTLLGGGGRDRLAGGPGGDTILAEPSDPGADAVAGQIWRLYQAVLGRAPDAAGLAGWVDRLAGDAGPAGASRAELNAAAQGFAASAEFQARYGGLSDAAFVSLLYRNVLDRAPDAAGLAAWTAKLARGADRAEVVTGFSESAEFVADSLPDTLRLGLAGRAAAAADDVFRLYQAVLDRTPDWQGLQGWSQRIAEGRSLQSVAEGFVGSAEFQARYGGLPDAAFVSLLYRNVLDRAPDAAGLAAWTAKLARGADRAEVVLKFSQSPELIGKSAAAVADWMQARGGDDRIEGGAGDNVLAGGIGADTFVFVQDDGGRHHIADPEPWDRIELRGFGYDGFDDVMAHVTGQGGNAVFSDQGVTIILHDIPPATLDPDMFSFF